MIYQFIQGLPLLIFAGCFLCSAIASDVSAEEDLAVIQEMSEWIKANGGFISDKVEVRHIVGSLSGVFAREDLDEGELVAKIPWNLTIHPPEDLIDESFCEKAEHLRLVLAKDPAELNPYERYLKKRSDTHVPLFWSEKGRELLSTLYSDEIMIHGFDSDVDDWCEYHGEGLRHAQMLLQTRGEGERIDVLVPYGDLLNHRNGIYTNAEPKVVDYSHHQVVTTRKVKAGEELVNSYNQCGFCDGLYDNLDEPSGLYVTPQLFEVYGFVEPLPQRWAVPRMQMIFDVEHDDEEDFDYVEFVTPVNALGIAFLQHRLEALEVYESKYKYYTGIPQHEVDAIFSLHSAMEHAFTLALEQAKEEVPEHEWNVAHHAAWHWSENYDDESETEL